MSNATDFNERVEAVATIKKVQFKVSASVMFGIAVLSVIIRFFLKVYHRRDFILDDYILFFGTACLISGTGVLFYQFDDMYLGPAIQSDPSLVFYLDTKSIQALVFDTTKYLNIYFSLLWTATFSVKFSFLAFFARLVESTPRLRLFHRFTIGLTTVSWAFVICVPFIICPHFGWQSVQCFTTPNTHLYNILIGTGGALDSLTDLMIVSIPVAILRQSKIPPRQALAVGAFLCLSVVMVIISLVRSSKIHGPKGVPIDVTWAIYWVHIEASVAILMVSLTAFRTVFNQKKEEEFRRARLKRPGNSWAKFMSFRRKKPTVQEDDMTALPQIPRATMTGLRTFIRGDRGTPTNSTINSSQGGMTLKSTSDNMSITPLPHLDEDAEGGPWISKPSWV